MKKIEENRKNAIELSVVIPCLNEEQGIGICVKKCLQVFKERGVNGEVIVSDNGSTDNSVKIALSAGAKVIHQPKKGYGNAYLKGFAEAKGKYIIMADADDTYDFLEIPKFLQYLRQDYDFVMGNRLNGGMKPGAMPWSHRWIGNPALTFILNFLFKCKIKDVYCGMRGITKETYERLNLQSTGWEFALEMLIKATKNKLKTAEVSIALHSRKGKSKLNTFSDGWRSFRFMILLSPLYLFVAPGLTLLLLGVILLASMLKGPVTIDGVRLDIHPMFIGSLLTILGYQIITLGFYSKLYAINSGFDKSNKILDYLLDHFTLEKGLLTGFLLILTGLIPGLLIIGNWVGSGFGNLNQVRTALFLLTITVVGTQTTFSSFFISIMGVEKRNQK